MNPVGGAIPASGDIAAAGYAESEALGALAAVTPPPRAPSG
ncbi:hypothetical protein Tbis_2727 [Thermobispora bispora DSM 43833]|uniref:Uncharacterized protein n=1 Tax=Thermobispora bispora (strain ATCC 19993 / DSM 43833 / CBS 139.67 / JCM 10125 / KCTC 9307 / NBRC 14880 / R51) TaxID=469371 RepID=D6Y611_THEBD|nr:hypothetical protein Tbis_2727 [Thermobispora bispora DSM 43833]